MELMRDVLDKQVLDRKGRKIGRVDGIVMELRDDAPPRIVGFEMGAVALGHRLGRRVGARVARLAVRLGGRIYAKPYRVPWSAVTDVGRDVEVSVDVRETPLHDWQGWLRRNIIGRIPGA
jgi:sporulation protein YlmC with PRC-barrel domain